jgi:hypothetical protein
MSSVTTQGLLIVYLHMFYELINMMECGMFSVAFISSQNNDGQTYMVS